MIAAAAFALLLGACSPQVVDTSFVISSDPELKARVGELLPELADRAGIELSRPVRVERRSREQLESYLIFKLDQELPPAEADLLAGSYAYLGLVPQYHKYYYSGYGYNDQQGPGYKQSCLVRRDFPEQVPL